MRRYIQKYYYTFKDLCSLTNQNLTLSNIIKLGYNGESYTFENPTSDIFTRAAMRFENWYFIATDEELSFTEEELTNLNSNKLYNLARKLKLWYLEEYDYFKARLDNYNALKDKLIAPLKTHTDVDNSNNNYDDDTPQIKIVDNTTIFDKAHASFYNYGDAHQESTTESDNLYNIQKLDELKRLYSNIEDEWATTLKRYIIAAEDDVDE